MFACVFFRGLLDVALECEGHNVYLFKLAVCVSAPRGFRPEGEISRRYSSSSRVYIEKYFYS